MITKKAFSIIEIVISVGILSITVFGIYKLIGENNKIITNSNNFLNQNLMYENVRECLKGKNFDEIFINFGEDLKSCNFSNEITQTKINNINYIIKVKSIKSGNKVIYWKINIESESIGNNQEKILKE